MALKLIANPPNPYESQYREFLAQSENGQWIGRSPYLEAVALRGDGVFDTLKQVSKMVLKTLS